MDLYRALLLIIFRLPYLFNLFVGTWLMHGCDTFRALPWALRTE